MTTPETLTQSATAAEFLTRHLLAANGEAAVNNPLLSVMLISLVRDAASIEQRIGEIVTALNAQP